MLAGENIFFGDRIGVLANGQREVPPRFVAASRRASDRPRAEISNRSKASVRRCARSRPQWRQWRAKRYCVDVGALRKSVPKQAFERDFAERSARLRSAENGLEGLRRLRKILASLLHFADFLVHLQQGFGGGLQLLRDFALGVGGELARVATPVCNSCLHLPELLRERCTRLLICAVMAWL